MQWLELLLFFPANLVNIARRTEKSWSAFLKRATNGSKENSTTTAEKSCLVTLLEDAVALLTASDRALLSTVLDVEVLEVKANGAALEATSQSEDEFPVAAVVVPIGVIAALGGLACVYVMLRRKLSSLSTKPIVVMKGIHTNYYPSDVNKVPTMTKPTYAPATTVSGRERGYSTI